MGDEQGMKYTIFEDSRIGKRPYQQDRIAHWKTRDALFLVVADGMGGHAAGGIREEAAATHPDRNKLLQCLGGPRAPRVEPTAHARLAQNDIVLLCSDGFWGPLTQRQLLMGLLGKEMKKALPELIALAETKGRPRGDNVSVLALEWHDKAVPAPVEPVTVPMDKIPTDVRDFSATEPDFLHMTDADIERQIAEIKKALKKHDPERK